MMYVNEEALSLQQVQRGGFASEFYFIQNDSLPKFFINRLSMI